MGKSLDEEEQKKILEMAAQGIDPKEIAKQTGHRESTIHKLLSKQFVTALATVGKQTAVVPSGGNDGQLIIRSMGDTTELSQNILFNPNAAVQAGQMFGFNAAHMAKTARRLYAGRGTEEEGEAFIGNIIGGILGLWKGSKSFDKVLPEEKEAIRRATQQPDIEEIVREALAKQDERTANIVALTIRRMKEEGMLNK